MHDTPDLVLGMSAVTAMSGAQVVIMRKHVFGSGPGAYVPPWTGITPVT